MAHYAENDSQDHASYIPIDSNFRDDDHDEYDIHIASPAEKRRIWWRAAVINACFIASWYVHITFKLLNHVYFSTAQVHICNRTLSVQQVDVLPRPIWISVSTLRNFPAHVCSVCIGCCASLVFSASFPAREKSIRRRLWVRAVSVTTSTRRGSVSSLDTNSNCSFFEARRQFLLLLLLVLISASQIYHSRQLHFHFTVSS
jgi:hypothetical protein